MTERLRAYVSGPYADERGHFGVALNIHRAELVAMELRKRGYAVFCPHLNSAHEDDLVPVQQFLEEDIEFLKFCDVMFLVPAMPGLKSCRDSRGTKIEIEYCREHFIPVVQTHLSISTIMIPEEWRYGIREAVMDEPENEEKLCS